jgi:TolA-binding protein
MTAAPEPEGAYEDPLVQVATDVDSLRRRIDDQGAMLRRNGTALSQLAESVGKVVEQGRKRERRQLLNSFVAYLLFTVLLGGGALFIYRTRSADLERARNDALAELAGAKRDLKTAQAQLGARDAASAQAYAFYQLARDPKRASDALARYVEVSQLALTPTEREVFAEGEQQARAKMVDAGWQSGLEAFRKNDFAKAVTELRRAANYETGGANAPQMHYYLGVALVRTKDAAGGIEELEAAIAGKVETTGIVDARYWLGVALEATGKPDQARREYEKFAAAQPMAPLAAQARARWVVIGQQLAAKKQAP